LINAGESWTKAIDAIAPMPLVIIGNEIHLFATTQSSLFQRTFDSTGNEKESLGIGNMQVAFADDSFFFAGFEQGFFRSPMVQIYNNGILKDSLGFSKYQDAYFLNAAFNPNNSTWLVVGAAGNKNYANHMAYAELVQYDGLKLSSKWTLSANTFEQLLPENVHQFGKIVAVTHDSNTDRWVISGEFLKGGSYVVLIDNEGKIQNVDLFKDFRFHKILVDSKGDYYFIGKRVYKNDVYAVFIKSTNGKVTFTSNQHLANSLYTDALMDIKSNQIVFVGIMQAQNENGLGGIPFIEGIDMGTGETIWHKKLTDTKWYGVTSITDIAFAPDYGFVLTLAGIDSKGNFIEPFVVGRVGNRGN
jgi:hypothetical protein